MTKEEKIQKIEEMVADYNERHKLTPDNTENASQVDFFHFNSTEEAAEASKTSNEEVTPEDWGLEPDTEYFELEFYVYKEVPEEEVEEIKKTMTGEIPDTPWFKAEHSKQYISKDFNYFMKQAEKALLV